MSEPNECDMALHILFRSIVLCHLHHTPSTEGLLVSQLFAVASVEATTTGTAGYRFQDAKQLTPISAAIVYDSSCCGIIELHRGVNPVGGPQTENSCDGTQRSTRMGSRKDTFDQADMVMTLGNVEEAFSCLNTAASFVMDTHWTCTSKVGQSCGKIVVQ